MGAPALGALCVPGRSGAPGSVWGRRAGVAGDRGATDPFVPFPLEWEGPLGAAWAPVLRLPLASLGGGVRLAMIRSARVGGPSSVTSTAGRITVESSTPFADPGALGRVCPLLGAPVALLTSLLLLAVVAVLGWATAPGRRVCGVGHPFGHAGVPSFGAVRLGHDRTRLAAPDGILRVSHAGGL